MAVTATPVPPVMVMAPLAVTVVAPPSARRVAVPVVAVSVIAVALVAAMVEPAVMVTLAAVAARLRAPVVAVTTVPVAPVTRATASLWWVRSPVERITNAPEPRMSPLAAGAAPNRTL